MFIIAEYVLKRSIDAEAVFIEIEINTERNVVLKIVSLVLLTFILASFPKLKECFEAPQKFLFEYGMKLR